MANPAHSDMTEEDAADLQFPKDCLSRVQIKQEPEDELDVTVVKEEIFTADPVCCTCTSILIEPYIKCAVCEDINICPQCFINGREIGRHKNDHDYVVVKNEFPLIDNSNWTAKEELELLNILQECGFGNWVDISRRMAGKSPEECKSHYLNCYIENRALPGLPKIKETPANIFGSEPVPYMFKLQDLEEPPRFTINTPNSRLLAGYNAARSDFEVNFDNHAERLVSDLKYNDFCEEDDDYELGRSLQTAIVGAYNNRLKERARRRKIVKDHGLIAFRRTMSWLRRYELTNQRDNAEKLLIFMQLVSGMEFDYIMEGLHHAGEIKNHINRLFDYRTNGLKYFHSISMFKKLLKIKHEYDRDRKANSNDDCSWRSIIPGTITNNCTTVVANTSQRRPPGPLEIVGLPEYDKLAKEEKELCSSARLIPLNYIEFKHIFINESQKSGHLTLASARRLLKIDVNKTRRIYDFLVQHGYINKRVTENDTQTARSPPQITSSNTIEGN